MSDRSSPDFEPVDPAVWQAIDRLVSEQKMQAALDQVAPILTTARDRGDVEAWTRALITSVQLQTALHGYETAVRYLRTEPWPEGPQRDRRRARVVLDLFYAHALAQYRNAYRYQIVQRETVVSTETVDLAAWTMAQLMTEINRAFARAWHDRATWGEASLGALAAYVEQNDYPARIRGTLRDTVSYLWAEVLVDSSAWSPAQTSGVYRLDLEALVRGDLSELDEPDEDLENPRLHPLQKLAIVLGDLESFHQKGNRPEASFEAARQRIASLRQHASRSADYQVLEQGLRARLDALGRRFPWWSKGMATFAELVRDGHPSPDRLVRAHRIATEGAEAFPQSIGGGQCHAIVTQIEQPSFQLSGMAVDGLGKRSIGIDHANLKALHFRAFRLPLEAILKGAGGPWRLVEPRRATAMINGREPDTAWTVELPPTRDFSSHRTDVVPPIEHHGFFLVVASARSDFRPGNNQIQGLILQQTDLVMLSRRTNDDRLEVTVRLGANGAAVDGAQVAVLRWGHGKPPVEVARHSTGADGRATFAVPPRQPWALLTRLDDQAVLDRAAYHGNRPYRQQRSEPRTLVYTDRSIYRPGQEILWKTVTYGPTTKSANPEDRQPGEPARSFGVRAGETLAVVLRDANSEVVAESEATSNDFGSATGSFRIPEGRLLGAWSLQATWNGHAQVRVEAYKRPTFEVAVDDPEEALRLNRPATVRGSAIYYFGLPVSEGEVDWRVVREPDARPYGRFGFSHWWPQPGPPEVVAAGRARLDPDGTFELTFEPSGDERDGDEGNGATRAAGRHGGLRRRPDTRYSFRIEADVTSAGGETRSGQRSFPVGTVAVDANIEHTAGFLLAGSEVTIDVARRALDGRPLAGPGRWRLVRVDQPEQALLPAEQPLPAPPEAVGAYLTESDRRRPRWRPGYEPWQIAAAWPDGQELASGKVSHGDDGQASLDLGTLEPGLLRLHYQTDDAFGATFETQTELWVVADGAGQSRRDSTHPSTLALPAVLALADDQAHPGETVRVLIASGRPNQKMVLEALRGHRTILRREITGGSNTWIDLPIGEDDRGGLTLRLASVADYQLIELQKRLEVPWDDRKLDITFTTFRDRLLPGAPESWRIALRGTEGPLAAGAAEVLASMYDRSLDLFAPHQPPNLLGVYPVRPAPPGIASVLGTANVVYTGGRGFGRQTHARYLRADRLRFFDNYPIGGPGRFGGGRPGVMRMSAKAMPEAAFADAPMAVSANVAEDSALTATAESAASPSPPPPAAAPPPPGGTAGALRENFAETAFWLPQLLVDDDGGVSFTFTAPDSVTSWNVWIEALTRDLRGGSARREVQTARDLLVRPQVPRFLREGDRARIVVLVDNTGTTPLHGSLELDIIDPATGTSRAEDFGLEPGGLRAAPFKVDPGQSVTVDVDLAAPRQIGDAALRVLGRASRSDGTGDELADGEQRPLPVLPGRMHLVTSRFAAVPPAGSRTLTFGDLADDDPQRSDEQLVVQVDGQLLLSVLEAMPFLVDYPYPSVESMLERYVSAGTLASLFDRVPKLAEVAAAMAAERDSRNERFDEPDANRTIDLVETPWLRTARGGPESSWGLLRILDPAVAANTRDAALDELRRAQRSDGAFPWFPGGPPSPTITLQVLFGLAKALDLEVEAVPEDVVQRAWSYLANHWRQDMRPRIRRGDCCWETASFFAYVLSAYPDTERWTGGVLTDDDRAQMLDLGMRHWRQTSPLVKVYLATALARTDRRQDADLVLDSVLDSARTDPDLGTYWQPEARAWLFYNDTLVGHTATLRALDELRPDDPHRDGLIQWLLLHKQLNHWQSTRGTAEVLYTLVRSMRRDAPLDAPDAAAVTIGDRQARFTFTPESYLAGKNQVVIPGDQVNPATMRSIDVRNEGTRAIFARATWHYATDQPPAAGDGDLFRIERRIFRRSATRDGYELEPLGPNSRVEIGDQLEVQLEIHSRAPAEYVHVRDPRPAGLEPEAPRSGYRWGDGLGRYEQIGESGTDLFFEHLPAGTATVRYRLRANLAGRFQAAPAVIQSVYAPAFAGHSAGNTLTIESRSE